VRMPSWRAVVAEKKQLAGQCEQAGQPIRPDLSRTLPDAKHIQKRGREVAAGTALPEKRM